MRNIFEELLYLHWKSYYKSPPKLIKDTRKEVCIVLSMQAGVIIYVLFIVVFRFFSPSFLDNIITPIFDRSRIEFVFYMVLFVLPFIIVFYNIYKKYDNEFD